VEFVLTPEQRSLGETTRRYLSQRVPVGQTRSTMESQEMVDAAMWSRFVRELSVAGIVVPPEWGGLGLTLSDAVIVMEALGEVVAPLPFLSAGILAPIALMAEGGDRAADLVASVCAGEAVVVIASGALGDIAKPAARQDKVGGRCLVTGVAPVVFEGMWATHYLVVTDTDAGPSFVLIARDDPGVKVEPVGTIDLTRPCARVILEGAEAEPIGPKGSVVSQSDGLNRLGALFLVWDMVGAASRVLEMSVAYAKERYQFGRPIGSFQGVKHRCADMLVRLEGARSAAGHAVWACDEDPGEADIAVAMAKSYAGQACTFIAESAIQIHGGIGFTWEHDAHLYLKRIKIDDMIFGGFRRHRKAVAQLLSLTTAQPQIPTM